MKIVMRMSVLNLAVSFVMSFCQIALTQQAESDSWRQWGGKNRDFQIIKGFNNPWEARPNHVWTKKIGPGHSAVVTDPEFGYCQFLDGEREVIRKFQLTTGQKIWEFKYDVGYASNNPHYSGPHATPTLMGDRLIAASIDAQIYVIDARTGSLIWKRDLREEFGTELPQSGYASSPLVHGNVVIVPTLGQATKSETESFNPLLKSKIPGIVGLNLENGKTVWRSKSFRSSHGSPILVKAFSSSVIILHGMFELIAVDPGDGAILWRKLLRDRAADNVSFTPIWDQKNNQLLISHGYCSKGTQAIGVAKKDRKWEVNVNWTNRDLRIVHTNAVLCGYALLGTNRNPTTLMSAIDVRDGSTLFRKRGFGKSNFLGCQDFVIFLDENELLFGAMVGSRGLNIIWQTKVLNSGAWTVPTLSSGRLYVRDANELKMYEFRNGS